MSEFTEVEDYTPSDDGGGLTKSNYVQAMAIQRPRVLDKVQARCLEEAAIAGEEFIYTWRAGGKVIEGLTIGAALCVARNMGNNVLDVKIEERPEAFYFIASYSDLETGFNMRRVFRQNRSALTKKDGGKVYSDERGADIQFQIGQSKAVRNVIMNAAPKWLTQKVMDKAKENVRKNIETMGAEKARQMLITRLEALKIPLELVQSTYGLPKGWDIVKLVQLSGAIRAIENGVESVDDVFPRGEPTASETLAQKATESLKETAKKSAQKEPPKEEAPMPTDAPVESAPEKVADNKGFNVADLGSPVIPEKKVDPVIELGLEATEEKPKLTGAMKALTEMVAKAKTEAMKKAAEDKIKMVLSNGNITEKQSQELLKQLVSEG